MRNEPITFIDSVANGKDVPRMLCTARVWP